MHRGKKKKSPKKMSIVRRSTRSPVTDYKQVYTILHNDSKKIGNDLFIPGSWDRL